MPLPALAMAGWMAAALLMLACWAVYRRIGNAGIVDVGWTLAVTMLAVVDALAARDSPAAWLLAGMFLVWGARLSRYLVRDRVWGRPEDGRYAALRAGWGEAAEWKFFLFFQAQAVLAVIFSVPALLVAAGPPRGIGGLELGALALWCAALLGEWTADRQLEQFKASPESRGRTCRDGLWRYSRHPNYFFEWLLWVSYAVMAWPAPGGVLALSAPLLMLYLVLRVTGIPPTEARALLSRGDDYRAYQASTSAFVPWFPRDRR